MNKGYIKDNIQEEDYVLGGGFVPDKIILNEKGDWSKFLPVFERQAEKFETWGCTVFATLNILESIFLKVTEKESNFSERFLYILAGIRAPGYSPHKLAEVIRDNGIVLQDKLPMTKTYAEFIEPDPIPVNILIEGQHFLNDFDFKHEWVYDDSDKRDKRKAKIKEALKYSPLGVSVHAWKKEGKIYVKSDFDEDNHWTMLYKIDDGGFYHIFDSYDDQFKVLSPDYDFERVKVYFLLKRTTPRKASDNVIKGILKTLISLYKSLFEIVKKEEEKITPPAPVVEKPKEELVVEKPIEKPVDKLELFCKAIQEFEGFYKGSRSYRNNNPGNIKFAFQANTTGKDPQGFAIFKTYNDGFNALKNMVRRACEGHSKVYSPNNTILEYFQIYAPASDNNYPEKYAKYVATKSGLSLKSKIRELII